MQISILAPREALREEDAQVGESRLAQVPIPRGGKRGLVAVSPGDHPQVLPQPAPPGNLRNPTLLYAQLQQTRDPSPQEQPLVRPLGELELPGSLRSPPPGR